MLSKRPGCLVLTRLDVLESILSNPGITSSEGSNLIDICKRRYEFHCRKLVRDGKVTFVRRQHTKYYYPSVGVLS